VAIGLVLIPPAPLARRLVAASRALGSELRLGPRARPHITLAMACLAPEALPALAAWLRSFARGTPAPEITLERTVALKGPRHVTAWVTVRRTRALAALHGACVKAVAARPRRRPTAAAFVRGPGERVSPSALRWVARYSEDAALGSYRPHVTLGYGEPADDPALPLTFVARRVALCHLGPHCTCARILAEARLSSLSRRKAGSRGPGRDRGRG
jgi:2'-5' RNA ligase